MKNIIKGIIGVFDGMLCARADDKPGVVMTLISKTQMAADHSINSHFLHYSFQLTAFFLSSTNVR